MGSASGMSPGGGFSEIRPMQVILNRVTPLYAHSITRSIIGSRNILITSNKQQDQIKKKTAMEVLWAGIRFKIKSDITRPFLSSMASKKKGKAVKIPAKMTIPTQNFHRKEGIFQASAHFKLNAER